MMVRLAVTDYQLPGDSIKISDNEEDNISKYDFS
jgi:hypothetical protein